MPTDHYHPARSVQSYDHRPFPEHDRSFVRRKRARDRSPVDQHNDERLYRSRSRHRANPAPRPGRDGQPGDVTLPKNFAKPLTCFFWSNNGRCSKRDQDCAYAHWNTGHLAEPPITVAAGIGFGSVAGKKARELASDTYTSSGDIEEREAALKHKEEELERREKALVSSKELLEKLKVKETQLEAREKALVEMAAETNTWVCAKCGHHGECPIIALILSSHIY
ncbi:hypothetical protein P280DRAFT_212227 [Massarina eburnea CBS 473.64]|uniref:C3H1-type domain-containing protein n=1 Tax=Massarina eburnea CBS 473.64 TaxID=1395130 RepID=A0A6A6RHT2_9PLEO|nr:hypothetical protein P280DRAFT_212227 [Massarina eburnea CBS 473.64]